MCGILTVFSNDPLSREEINESLNSLQRIKHRGPDGEGVLLINTNTGEAKSLRTKDTPENITCHYQELSEVPENQFNLLLGHRRLSIIDLSVQGHQPMQVDEISLIYNGEIYNYLELKEELKAKGRTFKTNSDSEVLIQAYLEWGAGCLNKFNGMWTFVLWDNSKQKLFISNDRFGVKPLYYTQVEDKTILVSEIKQYFDFTSFKREFNKEYFDDYIKVGSTNIGIETPFYEVKRFPCGHFTELKTKDGFRKEFFREYYSIYNIKKEKWKEKDAIHAFRELFFDSVQIRTRADVPYGIGLSGGLDSSSVLLGVKKMLDAKGLNGKPFTFSAVFPGNEEDESNYALKAGVFFNSKINLTNPLEEFSMDDFVNHIYHQDLLPPNASYYSEWKVSQLAKKNEVPVVLVGHGGDELFAGYHSHFDTFMLQNFRKFKFLNVIREIKKYAGNKNTPQKMYYLNILRTIKMGFRAHENLNKLTIEKLTIKDLNNYLKADFTKFQLPYYLLSDDRTSMASSVETRQPFLDYRVVEFGFSISDDLKIKNGWQKYIIREAFKELPNEIRWRKDKKGFTIPKANFEELLVGDENKDDIYVRSQVYRKNIAQLFKSQISK